MEQNNVDLATLIGSRICHDLISPIGAITNGLELLELTGTPHGPELDLISDSVGSAGARIRFFRIAYGAAGDQMLGCLETVSVLDDVGRGGRHKFHWSPKDPQPRAQVRLAFLAIQCCETAMPHGGDIRLSVQDGAWTVIGRAEKLTVDPALWSGLSDADQLPAITPALVQFALMPVIAADQGRQVRTDHSPDQITIRF